VAAAGWTDEAESDLADIFQSAENRSHMLKGGTALLSPAGKGAGFRITVPLASP
jgi:hypothetical protein